MEWRYNKEKREWRRKSLQYVDDWIIQRLQLPSRTNGRGVILKGFIEYQLCGNIMEPNRPAFKRLSHAKLVAQLLDHFSI